MEYLLCDICSVIYLFQQCKQNTFYIERYQLLLLLLTHNMVQCAACSAQLNGNWSINQSGYTTGAYLGVDAYFAYSSPNWVYCYCSNCFNNGNFANILKSYYSVPVKQITKELDQKIKILQKNIQDLNQIVANQQSTITSQQDTITSQKNTINYQKTMIQTLQDTIKTKQNTINTQQPIIKLYSQIFSINTITKLQKFEQYHKIFKNYSDQYGQQVSQYKQQIFIKNQQNFKEVTNKMLKFALNKLYDIKIGFENDVKQIQGLKKANIQQMKLLKSYSNKSNIFLDQQIQKSQQIFEIKIKQKQTEIANIGNCIQAGEKLKVDIQE